MGDRWGCKDLDTTNTCMYTRYPRLSKFGMTLIYFEDQRFLELPEWCRPGLLDCAKADLSTCHTLESIFFFFGGKNLQLNPYCTQDRALISLPVDLGGHNN